MDPFTLKKLAGHTDLNTTMRYVHLNDGDVRAVMEKARGWAQSEHNVVDIEHSASASEAVVDPKRKGLLWSWRRDLNPRPSDYKSDALPTELRQLLPPSYHASML